MAKVPFEGGGGGGGGGSSAQLASPPKKTASTKFDFYTLARQSQVDPAIDKKDI